MITLFILLTIAVLLSWKRYIKGELKWRDISLEVISSMYPERFKEKEGFVFFRAMATIIWLIIVLCTIALLLP
jgi:hypothetical protein